MFANHRLHTSVAACDGYLPASGPVLASARTIGCDVCRGRCEEGDEHSSRFGCPAARLLSSPGTVQLFTSAGSDLHAGVAKRDKRVRKVSSITAIILACFDAFPSSFYSSRLHSFLYSSFLAAVQCWKVQFFLRLVLFQLLV